MKDSFPRQVWISLGIIFCAIVAAVAGMVFVLNDVSARVVDITTSESMISAKNGDVTLLTSLEAGAAQAIPYAASINRLLPTQDGLIQFPQAIQTTAAAYNVSAQANFTGDPSLSNGIQGS